MLEITAENIRCHPIQKDEISFTHSIFAQCFLPLRKLRNSEKLYQVSHGKASFAIQAGVLLNPDTNKFEEQDVPYGSAARLVLAHIHNHIIRSKSIDEAQDIPMGDSLRKFFKSYQLKVCGSNGKQIIAQVNNIAAAKISIGVWHNNQPKQINVPTLAEEIEFWFEKDDRQKSLWQPHMILNRRYVETVRERPVPLDMRSIIGLYEKPRAIDLFTWLSYRLPSIKKNESVFIPFSGVNGLHNVFGNTIKHKGKFKSEFINSLHEVQKFYPEAMVSVESKGIRLRRSVPCVPYAKDIGNSRSLFFCG